MGKTKIEWCDYTCNCFWGCQNTCSYCQARSLARRFGVSIGSKRGYDSITIGRMASFMPVFLADQIAKIPKEPCLVFMSFMGDPFGDWNKPEWLYQAFEAMQERPSHTFMMLTKQPQNLVRWSPFPENCWVGASVTDQSTYEKALRGLSYVGATVRFLSFEPLLSPISFLGRDLDIFHWLIIGQQTPVSPKTTPKIEWVKEIVQAADKADVPVFLKDNLLELVNYDSPETNFAFNEKGEYRQEFPSVQGGQER